MNIGFIGLGHMGAPMALNLLKAGHTVSVFDLSASAMEMLAQAGARNAVSPKDAATGAEVVVTMLPAAVHVRSVLTADDGVFAGCGDSVTVIDSSTIDPTTARDMARMAEIRGLTFVDAPVSGGTGGAQAGTLTFMVGGTSEQYDRVVPVLKGMGKNIVHCGGVGTGQVAKICNNLVLGVTMAGTAEAMALGESLGIDPQVLAGIMNTSTGRSWSSETCNPYPGVVGTAPSSRGYTGGFGTDLMLKDLALAADAAKSARRPAFMGAIAQQLYQTASTRGLGGQDFSSVIMLYRDGDSVTK
ncbi:3-hydroxyisobutyrate dehydrogenase [Burkholderia sp. H160]|nr:3-hydroxyisobutyrate dehydrogenase [Burkholderia sp. H160]